jgi:hypothetical protein
VLGGPQGKAVSWRFIGTMVLAGARRRGPKIFAKTIAEYPFDLAFF